ncbi:hypothetical protein AWRI1631_140340, partial [Saccharomyces cerevisiae AWRI1631]
CLLLLLLLLLLQRSLRIVWMHRSPRKLAIGWGVSVSHLRILLVGNIL